MQVLFCRLTEEQRELYQQYLDSKEVQAILAGNYKVGTMAVLTPSCIAWQVFPGHFFMVLACYQGHNEVCGIRDQRSGIWVTALGSEITSHGIGISIFLRGQGSGCTTFEGSGAKVCQAFGSGITSHGIGIGSFLSDQ